LFIKITGDGAYDGHDARDLSWGVERRVAGPRRLAAHVDQVGPGGLEGARLRRRRRHVVPAAGAGAVKQTIA